MEWIFPEQKQSLIDHLLSNSEVYKSEFFTDHSIDKLHATTLLHDCNLAAQVILKTIEEKKKIYIYGDYDVDGICATTTLWRFIYYELNYLNVVPHVPNRFVDGYGLNSESIQKIIDEGGELIITVDCGVKDIELVGEYYQKIDFVITDHHSPRPLTDAKSDLHKVSRENIYSSHAKAVVHPQLENYPFKDICGAVVAWKLVRAMSEQLGKPELSEKYLQYAAIGTVGDIMPLLNENRSIVALGLKMINKTDIPGIDALLKVASIARGSVNAESIGYTLGPRLNASGRLDNAMIAVKLLSTSSKEYALKLATELNDLNTERQSLTKKYVALAEEQYKENPDTFVSVITGEDWPEGIVGLIAGKLTEKYYKPFIVGSINGDTIKASARSIEEINITEVLNAHATLLDKFGGHAQAAGMTFKRSNLDVFKKEMNNYVSTLLQGVKPTKRLKIDAIADPNELNIENVREISQLEPFGNQNRKPLIALKKLPVAMVSKMGSEGKHCKFLYKGIEFVYFNFECLPENNKQYDIAGYVDVESWNGREKVSFKIRHIRESI
jgi:single-stranded-DNA-specific exonuclease